MDITVEVQGLKGVEDALAQAGPKLAKRALRKALKAGGDFADGLIAFEGAWLGGETFVSFDQRAVALLVKQGRPAMLAETSR